MADYIVIEKFPSPHLVVDQDTGEAIIFETFKSAKREAELCQDGQVVLLTIGMRDVIRNKLKE